jgi:hypothetical protein
MIGAVNTWGTKEMEADLHLLLFGSVCPFVCLVSPFYYIMLTRKFQDYVIPDLVDIIWNYVS